MRFGYLLLAEAIGVDSSGAVTAIGLNRNILLADQLPARTKRAIVAHLEDVPAGELTFTITLKDPAGKVLMAQSGSAAVGDPLFEDIPSIADIPGELMVSVNAFGAHLIEIEVTHPDSEPIAADVALHVRQSPVS